jgi:hypothetical protein
MKRQKAARKKLKKLVKEFSPWSGWNLYEMTKTMLEFYKETYVIGDCCWSEDSRRLEIAKTLIEAVEAAKAIEYIDELSMDELIILAKKDGVAFTNFVNHWKAKNDISLDKTNIALLSGVAYSYLEKKYTKRLFNIIGTNIWDWCD